MSKNTRIYMEPIKRPAKHLPVSALAEPMELRDEGAAELEAEELATVHQMVEDLQTIYDRLKGE